MLRNPIYISSNNELEEIEDTDWTRSSWGSIMGNLADQTDLQAALSDTASYVNGSSSTISLGQAVYVSSEDTVDLAQAEDLVVSLVAGFVKDSSADSGRPVQIKTRGELDGFTGLISGTEYILSPDTPGGIVPRSTALSEGDWVCPVGIARNSTTLVIRILERHGA